MSFDVVSIACVVAIAQVAEETPFARFTQAASTYDLKLQDRARSPLTLMPQPIMKWSNPARNNEDGAVFLWLKDGRPEVIGSLFTYKIKRVRTKHELHSLATVPLKGTYQGTAVWNAPAAGVVFAAVPGASEPAETSRQRLVQLKALAREFTAKLTDKNQQATELRLLPQPLHRYEPTSGDVRDGAIFSFAIGTDPEALLLLELRRTGDVWRWEYAFARFHFDEITAWHQGKQVYYVERDGTQLNTNLGDPASRDKIYVTYHVE